MNKVQMIEGLLEAYDHAISSEEPDECARQFVIWMNHVADALFAANMTNEHQIWKRSQQRINFFPSDPSFAAQAESMKAILIGIGDRLYGREHFIDPDRIRQLRAVEPGQFDLTKLIGLCEELNICYSNNCLFAVVALTRTVLNHVPPIFGFQTFPEVASNYGGGSSVKACMKNLQESARKIADDHLHSLIQQHIALPNRVQVNFSNDLDRLLAEIVKILKTDGS